MRGYEFPLIEVEREDIISNQRQKVKTTKIRIWTKYGFVNEKEKGKKKKKNSERRKKES